jgi:processive 1,2-diacylglycerol beta-glucosyltransferase
MFDDNAGVASGIACAAILGHVGVDVLQGRVNLLHIHHQVTRTHQTNTISAVLRVLLTCAVALAPDVAVLGVCRRWPLLSDYATSSSPFWGRIALHAAAVLVAQAFAVGYKVCVVLFKVWRYRTLTAQGLTGEGRADGLAPRRILIVHASVGSGHKRAAQAIREALEAAYAADGTPVVIKTLDVVDSMEWFLKAVYKDGFMTLVTRDWGSAFVGLMFDKSNQTAPGITVGSSGFLQTVLEESFMLSFVETIFNFKPDVIVNTHFLSLKVLAHMRNTISAFDVPQVTVVTDYDVHAFWAVRPCERFFVARDECRHALTQFGIPDSTISVTGMPVVRDFSHNLPPRSECLAELGLDGSRPVILMMAGGDDVFETYDALLSLTMPLQIALVCGRYADKKAKLEAVVVPARHKCKLEGFTRKMHYYLQCADVIITKPGGLTTAESLATGTAMAIYHSLPGQEQRNADMILEGGAGFKISDARMLAYKLNKVIKEKAALLERMKGNAKRLGSVTAADKVAAFVKNGSFRG